MSQPIRMEVKPTLETRMGRMLAAGRLTATMTSEKTGVHMTVEFASKVKAGERRWKNSDFANATHVFITGGQGNKVATYYPQKGNLYFSTEDKAWQYAVKETLAASTRIQQDVPGVYRVEESSHCGRCGKELTDPVSIARGIGPTCLGAETGSTHYKAEPKSDDVPVSIPNESPDEAIARLNAESEQMAIGLGAINAATERDKKGRELPKSFAELAARVG